MQTTQTGSPKVKKVISTQPKKRGRPVGSKKMDKLNKINSEISKSTHKLLALYPAKEYLERELPDSEATVEQLNSLRRYNSLDGFESTPEISKWKLFCFVVLMGLVAGIILITPTIISMFDICTQ